MEKGIQSILRILVCHEEFHHLPGLPQIIEKTSNPDISDAY